MKPSDNLQPILRASRTGYSQRKQMGRKSKRDADVPAERIWSPPERSDQPPGEEVVQVNDTYLGGAPPPEAEPIRDDQHPTGG